MRRIFSPYHEKVAPYEFHCLREKEERISWQQQSQIAVRNIFLSNHSTYFSMRGMSEFVCDCKCDCFEGTSISSIPKLAKSLGIRFMDNLSFNARASLWRVSTFLYFSSCLHFDLIKIQKRRFCDYLVQNVDSSSVFELSVCPFCPF